MHDDHSPYRSPETSGQQVAPPPSGTSGSAIATLSLLIFPVVGSAVGFLGYIFAASMLEIRDTTTEPIRPYGQQAGLISLPMCTLICAAIGLGLALSIVRQYAAAILMLLLVSLSSWAINDSLWSDQNKRLGPDPSEAVLYYPPLACSACSLCTATFIAAVTVLAKKKAVT